MSEIDYSKCCVVAFSNSKGNYVKAMERLHESLRNNFSGTFLGFVGEQTIGAPIHSKIPYAFKIYAIKAALAAGFTKIIYVDSSCFAIKNIEPCFEELEQTGFLFQDSGYSAAEYLNDFSLNYFGVTREQAREIKLIGNAGMLGLNFDVDLPNQFFKKWERAMLDGCFNGEWHNNNFTESQSEECKGHRHDLVNSVIIYQMGLSNLIKPGNEWLQYAGVFDMINNETIIWKAQGM